MKNLLFTTILIFSLSANAGNSTKTKKVHQFKKERIIQASVEDVWKVVGEDFGAIANSHPKIVSSSYNQGSITYGGEGAERICNLNESGKKYIKEKQINFDPKNHKFTVQIFHIEGLPLDAENSKATYKVIAIDENTCKIEFEMFYKTDPAFLGGIAKGKFKKNIDDYLIAVEHHVKTRENVNKDNFKQIKKKYK